MTSIIPTRGSLWLWRIHLAVVSVLALFVLAMSARGVFHGWNALSVGSVAISMLFIVPLLASLTAEAGYVVQRRLAVRAIWRGLFVVLCAIFVSGLVIAFGVLVFLAFVPSSSMDVTSVASASLGAILFGIQVRIVWMYAYRSEHLWRETVAMQESLV